MLRVQWPTDSASSRSREREKVLFTTGFYHSLHVSQWLSEEEEEEVKKQREKRNETQLQMRYTTDEEMSEKNY